MCPLRIRSIFCLLITLLTIAPAFAQQAKAKRRRIDPRYAVTVHGASENNLKNVTVKFPLESFVVVSGVSGSGKSTLLRLMIGNVRPDGGGIIAWGKDVCSMSSRRCASSRRGLTPS